MIDARYDPQDAAEQRKGRIEAIVDDYLHGDSDEVMLARLKSLNLTPDETKDIRWKAQVARFNLPLGELARRIRLGHKNRITHATSGK